MELVTWSKSIFAPYRLSRKSLVYQLLGFQILNSFPVQMEVEGREITRESVQIVMHTTKVLALTTSSIVTPRSFLGSKVPAILKTSAAIGTVEFTGLLIMLTMALGQHLAIPSHKVFTIPAFMLKRSSLVMPGFLGTPAGIITRSMPVSASSNC